MGTNKAAFSMIEVMTALTVLAIGILGVSQMYFSAEAMNQFDTDRIQCFKLSHQTMENLLSMSVSDIKTYDQNHANMSQHQHRAFNAVNNRAVIISQSDLANLDPEDYDQGIPSTNGGAQNANMNQYNVNYEPITRMQEATTQITVTPLSWTTSPTSTTETVLIEVEVPEYGIKITAVKSSLNL